MGNCVKTNSCCRSSQKKDSITPSNILHIKKKIPRKLNITTSDFNNVMTSNFEHKSKLDVVTSDFEHKSKLDVVTSDFEHKSKLDVVTSDFKNTMINDELCLSIKNICQDEIVKPFNADYIIPFELNSTVVRKNVNNLTILVDYQHNICNSNNIQIVFKINPREFDEIEIPKQPNTTSPNTSMTILALLNHINNINKC
jgi:hypothetical protein